MPPVATIKCPGRSSQRWVFNNMHHKVPSGLLSNMVVPSSGQWEACSVPNTVLMILDIFSVPFDIYITYLMLCLNVKQILIVLYILQGEYSRKALQFLDVAGLHPGSHQEALAASLEWEVSHLLYVSPHLTVHPTATVPTDLCYAVGLLLLMSLWFPG